MNEDIEKALAFADRKDIELYEGGDALDAIHALAAAYREAKKDAELWRKDASEMEKERDSLMDQLHQAAYDQQHAREKFTEFRVQADRARKERDQALERLERAERGWACDQKVSDAWKDRAEAAEARVKELEEKHGQGFPNPIAEQEHRLLRTEYYRMRNVLDAKIKSLTAEIERKDAALRETLDWFSVFRPEIECNAVLAALKPQEAGECCDGQDPEHPSCFKGNDPAGKLKAAE